MQSSPTSTTANTAIGWRSVATQDAEMLQVNHYYPFGMLMGESSGGDVQPWKYGGKELTREGGINLCDFEARAFNNLRFTSPDPLAESYYPTSPYAYCLNNPLRNIDPTGKEVYLFATNLPAINTSWLSINDIANSALSSATHTFIIVTNSDGTLRDYFAYGPTEGGIAVLGLGGPLKKNEYSQDLNVWDGSDTEHLKARISVPVPEGMTQKEFDDKVIETAKSFGNNPNVIYALDPTSPLEGNCNSSSSTILLKSGVSKDVMKQIAKKIPGIKWGFGISPRPWTKEEQKKADTKLNRFIRKATNAYILYKKLIPLHLP